MLSLPIDLPGNGPDIRLSPPCEGKILLHCCCAPCSSAILEACIKNNLDLTVFFSNSNIFPHQEYETRKKELISYCERLNVPYIEDVYDHADWQKQVATDLEWTPERGARCQKCFRYRLKRAAEYAQNHGYAVLTTTLASSRWKDLEQINRAGELAVSQLNEGNKPQWWDMNWRKEGLQLRRSQLVKELGFYNQLYCGCEYSMVKEGSIVMFPPAKINLGLNVMRKREDGFHDIQTLFYPVFGLCDRLEVRKSDEFNAELDGINWPVEKDLCVKAFRLMQEKYGIGNVHLILHKEIPVGAGLGGGSSDCAFTIKALNRLFELGLSIEEMEELASSLGSDCAFFIKCRPSWGEGKGDVLETAKDCLKRYTIKVEIPKGEHINTALAYSKIVPHIHTPHLRDVIEGSNIEQWKRLLHNDFEDSVFLEHPRIAQLKKEMYLRGAVYASMSGSGAAVYGIFKK